MKYFKIDPSRDLLVPSVKMVQLNIGDAVAQCIANGEVIDKEMSQVPNWSNFAKNPKQNQGWFSRILESVFLGKHGNTHMNIDLLLNKKRTGSLVSLMWLAHQTGIKDGTLLEIAQMAREVLPAWCVIALGGGDIRINGNKITNKNAESVVQEVVKKCVANNQSVLILSSQMAQRSFSIPEITELYLAYDKGSAGTTVQKMSRALTPNTNDPDKVGVIVSLSFDPNRDDKFDAVIIQTVENYRSRHPDKSLSDSMQEVLDVLDIWSGDVNKIMRVEKDEYHAQLIARKSLSRIIGAQADVTKLDNDTIIDLLRTTMEYTKANPTSYIPVEKKKNVLDDENNPPEDEEEFLLVKRNKKNEKEKLYLKIKEKITAVADNWQHIMSCLGVTKVRDVVPTLKSDPSIADDFEQEYSLKVATIEKLVDKQILNITWLEYFHERSEKC